ARSSTGSLRWPAASTWRLLRRRSSVAPMRRFWAVLAALACIRVAIPLAALAHADLPGLPRYRHHALSGDATGFYAATREFMAAWARLPRIGFALLALFTLAFMVWVAREWVRRPDRRWWLVPLTLLALG